MKTSHFLKIAAILIFAMAFTLTGCKKDDLTSGTKDSKSLKQLSADEANVEQLTDESLQDVDGFLTQGGNAGGLKSIEGNGIPCNVTVDSAYVLNDTLTIIFNYDGLDCNGKRLRTGKVEISKKIGSFWFQAGSAVTIKYINFSVTKVATGVTTVFNGTRKFENVTGGGIWQLYNGTASSIVHRISGNMNVTFDDGTTRSWNMARQRTYTGTLQNLLCTVDGFGTSGDYSNLVSWGTNRDGELFYTQISQSIVHRKACEWHPVSGIKVHMIPSASKSGTVTFGFDSNNQPVTGDDCPTHYKLDWVNGNQTGTSYLPLP